MVELMVVDHQGSENQCQKISVKLYDIVGSGGKLEVRVQVCECFMVITCLVTQWFNRGEWLVIGEAQGFPSMGGG